MLLENIQSDLKQAIKAKQDFQVSILRFLLAAIRNKEIELNKRGKLTDEEVVSVIKKQAKQHRESIEAYQKSGRVDLVDKETKELEYLSKYLPREISTSEIEKVVKKAIQKINAKSPQDFGKVMGLVMKDLKGKADGKKVSELVKRELE